VKNINENANQYSYRYIDSSGNGGKFKDASDVIVQVKPYVPVYLYRSESVKKASRWFVEKFVDFKGLGNKEFRGKVLFSIKSNPDERVIKDVFNSGIKNFDVASINEVKRVDALLGKDARLYFMHPIKAYEAICESYFCYEVKDYSFDSEEELDKILEATKGAKDLNLHLRIAMDCGSSAIDLSEKFGIKLESCLELSKKARGRVKNFGVCFHVGSQCMNPKEYFDATKNVAKFFAKNDIGLDSFNVGGGFPSSYPGMKAGSISEYLKQIKDAIKEADLKGGCEILCEPGRAVTAECESLLVRVEARKDKMLYINDGTYGGLFDAGSLKFSYFCKAHDNKGVEILSKNKEDFGFYGPTCDSIDFMQGPFNIPDSIKAGDYIEIFNLGSYSKSLRSNFNGYGEVLQFDVGDQIDKEFCQVF
jgi:ornithine decarboxylase